MSKDHYYPNCRITDISEKFSGKIHTLVVNHDRQEYYFDDLFLAVLENINDLEIKLELIDRFGCTEEEFEDVRNLIIDRKFVVLKSEIDKVKIGILTERMSLGFGVDLVVHETAKSLQSDFGYEVTVFAGKVEEIYQKSSYNIVSLDKELNLGSDTFSQKYHTAAIPYLNSQGIDIWLIETPPFYYWKDQLVAPIIFVEHGTPDGHFFPRKMRIIVESANWTKKYLIFDKLRSFDKIVTVSEYLKNQLSPEARKQTTVIHNGADHYRIAKDNEIKEFKKEYGFKDDDFIILSVGRIDLDPQKSPYKGIEELLDIFKSVKDVNPSIKLMTAGRGEEKYETFLKEHGVIPLMNVSKQMIPVVYGACDLYVTASRWEGFNLPLAEAQYAGKPCVAFKLCAHPEVVKDGYSGFLVDSKGEFESKILDLAKNRDLLETMKKNSWEYAKLFSWSSSALKLDELIDSILFKGRSYIDRSRKIKDSYFLRMYCHIALNILKTEGLSGLCLIAYYELSKKLKYYFKT